MRFNSVAAIDTDSAAIARAVAMTGPPERIAFRKGDVMMDKLDDEGCDLIAVMAALHHLPLRAALLRFRTLAQPGGVLAVVGLYRLRSPADYAIAAAAWPTSWLMRWRYGYVDVRTPERRPLETLQEIRSACDDILLGAEFRRRLFFRYTLIWRKPGL